MYTKERRGGSSHDVNSARESARSIRPKSGKASSKRPSPAWEGKLDSRSGQRVRSTEDLTRETWRNNSRKGVLYDSESEEEEIVQQASRLSLKSSQQFPRASRSEMDASGDSQKQRSPLSPQRSYSKFDTSYNDFLNSSRLAQTISTNPEKQKLSLHLIEKIKNEDYIDFGDFLPQNVLEFTAWDNKHVTRTMDNSQMPKVTEFSEWVQCMMVYVSVLVQEYPERIADLLGYVLNISMLYQESDEKGAWIRYDDAFRRKAALRKGLSWSKWDKELWVLAS